MVDHVNLRRVSAGLVLISILGQIFVLFHTTSNRSLSVLTQAQQGEEWLLARLTSPTSFDTTFEDSSTPSDSPKTTTNEESFGACLLVNDENQRLPEWLAYHYYMLPLRHLVLMVDPHSQTSPLDIVQRWRPFLTIEIWSDKDIGGFIPSNRTDDNGLIRTHRTRQEKFYRYCGRHLQSQTITPKLTWITFHDVDEYVYLDPHLIPDAPNRMNQSGSIMKFIQDLTMQSKSNHNHTGNQIHFYSRRMFKMATAALESGCFALPRTYYGTTEEPDLVQSHVPYFFNGSDFETLRWLHRTSHRDIMNNGHAKSMVHVSSADDPPNTTETSWKLNFKRSSHRVLKECGSDFLWIRIRHYLGSWDAYTSRKDVRRYHEYYEYRSHFGEQDPTDDSVRMWLTRFSEQMMGRVGTNSTTIQYLLQGTGKYPPLNDSIREANINHFTPEQIKEKIDRMEEDKQKGEKITDEFTVWLKNNFDVTTLANGTVMATRIRKE